MYLCISLCVNSHINQDVCSKLLPYILQYNLIILIIKNLFCFMWDFWWQIFCGLVIPKNILIVISRFNDNVIENYRFQVQILHPPNH